MESLQAIKNRLRAVNNIGKITKAMEVVAATKMRKAQELAINSRAYAWHALELLARLSSQGTKNIPLLLPREVKNTLIILVSSDRGLVGSFNNQLFRLAEDYVRSNMLTSENSKFIVIGKKALNFAEKNKYLIEEKFLNFGNLAQTIEMGPVSNLIISGYLAGRWDRVVTISMNFKTTLTQNAVLREIMPINFENIRRAVREIVPEHGRYAGLKDITGTKELPSTDYIFEPSRDEILNNLIPHLLKMQFYHIMLEANASEHSARRVAMKTASDNADEVAAELGMDYNKARQSNITRELIEITSTQSALAN